MAHTSKELEVIDPEQLAYGTTSHVYPVEVFIRENSVVMYVVPRTKDNGRC